MSSILFEIKDHTGFITLNRPDKLNAMTPTLLGELKAAFEQANSDLHRLNNDLMQLQGRRESILGRLRVLLNSELEVLKALDAGDRIPAVSAPPPNVSWSPIVALVKLKPR